MKTLVRGLVTTAILAALLVVYAVPAQADTQNVTTTVNCTSGSYGQSNNCYAVTNQTMGDRNQVYKHVPVGAGMDQTATAAAAGMLLSTTAGALITFKKIRG